MTWPTHIAIRLLGCEVFAIELIPPLPDPGIRDCTTEAHTIGFITNDLPTWHQPPK